MEKLVLIFVLFAGRSAAQSVGVKPESHPQITRTVIGTIKNADGADVSECVVKLKFGDDSLLTVSDMSGHFTFKNVNSALFIVTIYASGYSILTYKYFGDDKANLITLPDKTLEYIHHINNEFSEKKWKAGDKIDAGPDIFRPALVLAASYDNTSFKVHYEDGSHPDGWIDGSLTRPYNLQYKADSAAAVKGLRPGKYVMYKYDRDIGRYQGYFMIQIDGTYEVFRDDKQTTQYSQWRTGNNGKYNFDLTTGIIKWLTGPFSNLSSHLSVSIDGQAYAIQPLTTGGPSGGYVDTK